MRRFFFFFFLTTFQSLFSHQYLKGWEWCQRASVKSKKKGRSLLPIKLCANCCLLMMTYRCLRWPGVEGASFNLLQFGLLHSYRLTWKCRQTFSQSNRQMIDVDHTSHAVLRNYWYFWRPNIRWLYGTVWYVVRKPADRIVGSCKQLFQKSGWILTLF